MFGYNNNGYGGGVYIPPVTQRPVMQPATTFVPAPQSSLGQMQAPMQAQSYIQPFQDVRFVNEKEADAFIVLPNQKVLLLDPQNNKMWIKWADSMGQSNTEYYRYEKMSAGGGDTVIVESDNKPVTTAIDTDQFALKNDLKNMPTRDEIDSLRETIEQLKKQVRISQILNEKPVLDIKKEQ